MKRLLTLALVIGLILGAGAPCLCAERNVFRIATAADPETLDPMEQLSSSALAFCHLVYDPLVRWNADMKIEPRLAERWEQIDPLTLRLHLRKGVRFQTGNPFTAKDVAWTLNRLKRSYDFKALYEVIAGSKVIDDYTIDIIAKEPYGLTLNLAAYIFPMDSVFFSGRDEKGMDKGIIVKDGYSFASEHTAGTGPFKIAARRRGVKFVLKANEDYWGERGNVDVIEWIPIKNETARVRALLHGDVDCISPVPIEAYDRLMQTPGIELIAKPSARIITIQMNGVKNMALADVRVRKALIAATDNDALVAQIMHGRAKPLYQQAPEGMPGHEPSLGSRYNLEEAHALLKAAGYEGDLELSMIAPDNRYVKDVEVAQAFVSMMAKAGVKVMLKTHRHSQYWNEFDNQVADLQMIGWYPDTEDTVNYGEYLLMCFDRDTGKGQYNSGNYCNPAYDALLRGANREMDAAKRTAMLIESERIVYDDAAFIPLYTEFFSWAVRSTVANLKDVAASQDFLYAGDLVMR